MASFYYNYQNARYQFSFLFKLIFYSLFRIVEHLPLIIWQKKIGESILVVLVFDTIVQKPNWGNYYSITVILPF